MASDVNSFIIMEKYAKFAARRDRKHVDFWPKSPEPPEILYEAPASASTSTITTAVTKREHQDTSTTKAVLVRPVSTSEFGPAPFKKPKLNDKSYGRKMLPGEGSAMAEFVSRGARVPRRGEIGMSEQEIEKLKRSGYVMSGARHSTMNAVRERKEDQVITAEQQQGTFLQTLAQLIQRQQEIDLKETQLISNFKSLIEQRIKKIKK